MRYWYQNPNPLLANYIRTVLIIEGFADAQDAGVPLFTNGMPAFYCRIEKTTGENDRVEDLKLFGQSTSDDCWLLSQRSTIITYFFKPFALATLFNVSASKLVKGPFDLHEWNAHKINALRTQLIYATSTKERVAALDHLLLHLLEENKQACEVIRVATDAMMENSGPEVLESVLKKLKIHTRTFQRMFKKCVGVSPNQYRRICQFQLSFTQLRTGEFDTLTDVAYDNGFADQSHFIRSFREHAAITPNDYLKSGLNKKK